MDRLFREQNMITIVSSVAKEGIKPETIADLYQSGRTIIEISAQLKLRKNIVLDLLRIFAKAKKLKVIRRTDPINDPSRKQLHYKLFEAESEIFIGMAEKDEIEIGKEILFTTDLYDYYITPKIIDGLNVYITINKYNPLEDKEDIDGSPFI